MLDAIGAPRDGVGQGDRRFHLLRLALQPLLHDELFQNFMFGGLGVPEIHHFVHQLVDCDEVLLDAFVAHLVEVVPEDVNDAVQKLGHEQRRHLALHDGYEKHAVPLHVDEVELGRHQHRVDLCRVRRSLHLRPEKVTARPAHHPAVVLLDQHLAL